MGLRLPPMLARLSTLLRPATGSSQEPSRGLESAGQPPGRHPSRLPPPPSALSRRGGLASLGSRRLMWRLEPARPPPLDFLGSWDVFQNPHTLVRDVGGTYGASLRVFCGAGDLWEDRLTRPGGALAYGRPGTLSGFRRQNRFTSRQMLFVPARS